MSPTKTREPATRPEETQSPAGAVPAPDLTPAQVAVAPTANGQGGPGAPVLQPPGSKKNGLAAQAAIEGISTTSATVGGLWTSNDQSNSWIYLNGVGWRRLSAANAGAHHAMLQIARLAKDGSIVVQCEEDGSVVHTIYVW